MCVVEQKKHVFFNERLPAGWEIKPVDQLKAKEKYACTAGPFGSNISAKYFKEFGVPVIRGGNLSLGQELFIAKDFVFVSEDKAKTFPGQHVRAGDLVFTCWGTLGQVGLIPQDGPYSEYIISNKQLKLRPDSALYDSRYLYYYFSLPQMIRHINDIAIGSAVPGINLGLLKRIKIVVPPLNVQKKIVAVISSYDDLIENNKRRIALLEKMAEEIYREWFVRFRFPGYQTVEFEKGFPKSWEPRRFGLFCKFYKGKNPVEVLDTIDADLVSYVNINTLTGNSNSFARPQKNSVMCNTGDTLMIMDGSRSGLVFRTNVDGVVGSTMSVIRVEEKLRNFVFEYLRAMCEAIVFNNTGSAIPHANKDYINRMILFVPKNDSLLSNFNKKYETINQSIKNLKKQNKNLGQTKEMLLPRLISGKLSVADLDIQFPPSMVDNKVA